MNIKIEDFKKSIRERNLKNREIIIETIKEKYRDITINERKGTPQKGKYMYDFIWIDGEYNDTNFRICLYYQDIDLDSLNVHIFHGPYTFQRNLIENAPKSPVSIFKGNLTCQESFQKVMKNIGHSTYDADNFEIEGFIIEFLEYLKYPNKK